MYKLRNNQNMKNGNSIVYFYGYLILDKKYQIQKRRYLQNPYKQAIKSVNFILISIVQSLALKY